jgi:hypothetical protein
MIHVSEILTREARLTRVISKYLLPKRIRRLGIILQTLSLAREDSENAVIMDNSLIFRDHAGELTLPNNVTWLLFVKDSQRMPQAVVIRFN